MVNVIKVYYEHKNNSYFFFIRKWKIVMDSLIVITFIGTVVEVAVCSQECPLYYSDKIGLAPVLLFFIEV